MPGMSKAHFSRAISPPRTGRHILLSVTVLLIALTIGAVRSHAHLLGEGVVFLSIQQDRIDGHADLLLTDANDIIFEDGVNDGILTVEELDSGMERLKSYLAERISIAASEGDLKIDFKGYKVREAPKVPYSFVQVFFSIDSVPSRLKSLRVRYSALFDIRHRHRGLLVIDRNIFTGYENTTEAVSLVFTRKSQIQELDLARDPESNLFASYFKLGVNHVLVGYDHILFLMAFLLTAVLGRTNGAWSPSRSVGQVLWYVSGIVVVFALAHGIAMAFEFQLAETLPPRFAEVAIATTIVVAAGNYLYPIPQRWTPLIVFPLALLHGLGIAAIMSGTGVPIYLEFQFLLGFNLGIAIGQAILVTLSLPVFYRLRLRQRYVRLAVPAGSGAIACIGVLLIAERVLQ